MGRHGKVTWDAIFKDFKLKHPGKAKKVLGFQPYSYATIVLIFPNRIRETYNYDTKKVTRLTHKEWEDRQRGLVL